MLFWMVTLGALALDAASKLLAAGLLGDRTIKLGWLVELQQTQNTGMALGILADNRAASIILPATAILCGWLLMRRYRITRYTAVACGLIAGGFIGNFGERLLHGYVLDMIYFPWLPWFVCNVADICICFGVAGLAFSLLFRAQDWQENRPAPEAHRSNCSHSNSSNGPDLTLPQQKRGNKRCP